MGSVRQSVLSVPYRLGSESFCPPALCCPDLRTLFANSFTEFIRIGGTMNSRITYTYWTLTAVFCLFITFSGLGDLVSAEAVVSDLLQLGYPAHLAPFLGVAKLLGVAALLAPGLPRLKEWAYAGLSFDLSGAIFSALALGIVDSDLVMASIGLLLLVAAYVSYRLAERAGVAAGLIRPRRARPIAVDSAR
jgi:hypothetical protein